MSQAALVNGSRGRNIKESDRRFIRVLIGAHRRLLGVSSGRLLGRMGGHPLLILTTSGRRTGQPYSTPVIGIGSWSPATAARLPSRYGYATSSLGLGAQA
jgi:hypothetical protein